MRRQILDATLAARRDKLPVALVTDLATGRQRLVDPDGSSGDLDLAEDMIGAAREALREDRSGVLDASDGKLFVQVFTPPLRLVIVGAVHIAQSLAPMASLAGYEVTVIDPRRAFATAERFPGVTITDDWPDEALERIAPDYRTAVVTLTHDPKLDDAALAVALRSEVFYIGCLGSQKTHGARLKRLRRAGFGDEDMARIHGPIGLDLGGKLPAEIAVATLAEITQIRHARARA